MVGRIIKWFGRYGGEKLEVSVGLKLISVFKFCEPHFGTFYLSNQDELDFGTLSKVGDLA